MLEMAMFQIIPLTVPPKKLNPFTKTPNTFNQRSTSVIIKQHLEESPTIFKQPNNIQKLQPSTSFQTSPTKITGLDVVPWGMPPTTRSFIRFSWRNCKICVETWGRGMVGFHKGIYWIQRALQWTMFSREVLKTSFFWVLKLGLSENFGETPQNPVGVSSCGHHFKPTTIRTY